MQSDRRRSHPRLQRVILEEPIGLRGQDAAFVGFVGNNPCNRKDPLGVEAGAVTLGVWAPAAKPLPYDLAYGPTAVNRDSSGDGHLRLFCQDCVPDNPRANCVRKCLVQTSRGWDGDVLDLTYYYSPLHPMCWVESELGPMEFGTLHNE